LILKKKYSAGGHSWSADDNSLVRPKLNILIWDSTLCLWHNIQVLILAFLLLYLGRCRLRSWWKRIRICIRNEVDKKCRQFQSV